jgi:hypothetical protein
MPWNIRGCPHSFVDSNTELKVTTHSLIQNHIQFITSLCLITDAISLAAKHFAVAINCIRCSCGVEIECSARPVRWDYYKPVCVCVCSTVQGIRNVPTSLISSFSVILPKFFRLLRLLSSSSSPSSSVALQPLWGSWPPHTGGFVMYLGLLWMGDQPVAKASTYTPQHNTERRRQTSMPYAGFEPTISESKRSMTSPHTARRLGPAVGLQCNLIVFILYHQLAVRILYGSYL